MGGMVPTYSPVWPLEQSGWNFRFQPEGGLYYFSSIKVWLKSFPIVFFPHHNLYVDVTCSANLFWCKRQPLFGCDKNLILGTDKLVRKCWNNKYWDDPNRLEYISNLGGQNWLQDYIHVVLPIILPESILCCHIMEHAQHFHSQALNHLPSFKKIDNFLLAVILLWTRCILFSDGTHHHGALL